MFNSKYVLNFIKKHSFSKVKIEIYKMMGCQFASVIAQFIWHPASHTHNVLPHPCAASRDLDPQSVGLFEKC